MMPVPIRAARREDYAAISRLVSDPHELLLVFPAARWPLTLRQIERLADQRSDLTVAHDGNRLLGFADLYDINPGAWAFIGNLVVARECRGQGIGKRMLQHMLERIFGVYDIPEARLSVFAENRRALGLYRKFGFTTYASEQRRASGNRQVTLLQMHLRR